MSEKETNVQTRPLSVASSPHLGTADSTPGIMLDVIIALIPALVSAVWFFGPRSTAS